MSARPSPTNIATGLAAIASALCLLLGRRIQRSRGMHSSLLSSAIVFLLTPLAFSLTPPSSSYAATLTVCSGCVYTTIAAAIAAASPGDTIRIQDTVQSEANITVDRDLTIQGQGAASTAVDGGLGGTVFFIDFGVTATIQDMTIRQGSDIFGFGGGIYNSGTLTISNSTLSGNSAMFGGGGIYNNNAVTISNSTISGNLAGNYGGGIYNAGTLTVSNSTISGNFATGSSGGGIYNQNLSTVAIANSTLSGNSAGFSGGGVENDGDSVTISNGTLSGNSATFFGSGISSTSGTTVKNSVVANSLGASDCYGTITALGANLDTDGSCGTINFTQVTPPQLNLGPLASNKPGTTDTQALLPGSVAIDAAADCTDASGTAVTTDQRGVARPDNGESACDIGAYEFVDTINCSVIYNGTFHGNLYISRGLTCIINGTVTGNVNQSGGGLFASNAKIGGNLQITGGGTFSIAGTAVNGNVQIQNLPAGSAQNRICGTRVKGNLTFHNNGTAVAIGTTSSASCPGNTIGNDLQINNNLALVQVFDDAVGGNLQCQGNSSITGSGDTAKSLQGQCAGF